MSFTMFTSIMLGRKLLGMMPSSSKFSRLVSKDANSLNPVVDRINE